MAKYRVCKGESLSYGTNATDQKAYAEGAVVDMPADMGDPLVERGILEAVAAAGKPAVTVKADDK